MSCFGMPENGSILNLIVVLKLEEKLCRSQPHTLGIYIEELPSSTHTITAAPTSITVFVGYTHPFKTNPNNWGKAVQIFSFTDYEREFGEFFANAVFDSDSESAHFGSVAHAVNQFFLNGGANAYVIGLQASSGGSPVTAPTVTISGVTFTARELTDPTHEMVVTINNVQADTADITITYGSGAGAQVETFRKVSTQAQDASGHANPNYIETRIGVSLLVTVAPSGTSYPSTFTAGSGTMAHVPASGSTIFNVADFAPIFQQDSSLDNLPIFNILVIPGVTNPAILSEAIAFCERKQAFLIMDPPINEIANQGGSNWIGDYMTSPTAPKSINAALYFPYIVSTDPTTGNPIHLPPSTIPHKSLGIHPARPRKVPAHSICCTLSMSW